MKNANRKPANKGRKYPPEVLTDAEARALLRAPSGSAPTGIRNRALIACLWGAGCRVGEALALRPKDFDREQGTLRILHGKGDRARTVVLAPECVPYLERWLDRRTALGVNGRHVLFCTLKGGPLSSAYIRGLLPSMAQRAGIEKRCHAHGLRHSHAFKLRNDGVSLDTIQRQLGHATLAETARYIAHLCPKERAAEIQAAWKPEGEPTPPKPKRKPAPKPKTETRPRRPTADPKTIARLRDRLARLTHDLLDPEQDDETRAALRNEMDELRERLVKKVQDTYTE